MNTVIREKFPFGEDWWRGCSMVFCGFLFYSWGCIHESRSRVSIYCFCITSYMYMWRRVSCTSIRLWLCIFVEYHSSRLEIPILISNSYSTTIRMTIGMPKCWKQRVGGRDFCVFCQSHIRNKIETRFFLSSDFSDKILSSFWSFLFLPSSLFSILTETLLYKKKKIWICVFCVK